MKQERKRGFVSQLNYWLSVTAIGMVLGLSIQFAKAWTPPSAEPPTATVAAPITTGNQTQVKTGGLILNSTLKVSTADAGPWGLIVKNNKAPGAGFQVYQKDNGDVEMWNNHVGGTGRLISLTYGGNVGIGTGFPSEKLQVTGNVRASDVYIEKVSKWASELGGGAADNLGNHTATASLNLAGNSVVGVNDITVSRLLDRENPGYYLNPNGTSWIHTLRTANTVVPVSNNYALISLDGSGNYNSSKKAVAGSLHVNDIYLRSSGKWLSDVADGAGAPVSGAVIAGSVAGYNWGGATAVSCPAGTTRVSWQTHPETSTAADASTTHSLCIKN